MRIERRRFGSAPGLRGVTTNVGFGRRLVTTIAKGTFWARMFMVAAVALGLGGCGAGLMVGAQPAAEPPSGPAAVYSVSRCTAADGSPVAIEPPLTYYLATAPGPEAEALALYEYAAGGQGTAFTNHVRDQRGDVFVGYVRLAPGFRFHLPSDRSLPGSRWVYDAGTYDTAEREDGTLSIAGEPLLTCAMEPTGGAWACGSDIDCTGDLICVDRQCVEAPAATIARVGSPDARRRPAACGSDTDCGRGLQCVDGLCATAPLPGAKGRCRQDWDCPGEHICLRRRCADRFLLSPPPPKTCRRDWHCPSTDACVDRECVSLATLSEGVVKSCRADWNCPGEQCCVRKKCRAVDDMRRARPAKCRRTADCPSGHECRSARCESVVEAPGAPTRCRVDVDCPGDLICIDGACQATPGALGPATPASALSACTTDMDCEGALVCRAGSCTTMTATTSAPSVEEDVSEDTTTDSDELEFAWDSSDDETAAETAAADEAPQTPIDETWRLGLGGFVSFAGVSTYRGDTCRGCEFNMDTSGGFSVFAELPVVDRYLAIGPRMNVGFWKLEGTSDSWTLLDVDVQVTGRLPLLDDRLEPFVSLLLGGSFHFPPSAYSNDDLYGWNVGLRIGVGYTFWKGLGVAFALGYEYHDQYEGGDTAKRSFFHDGVADFTVFYRF